MNVTRRSALALAAAGLTVTALGCDGPGLFLGGVSEEEGSAGTLLRSKVRLPPPFTVPLPVPPVLRPDRSGAVADHYELTQKPGVLRVIPGVDTRIWGYDGRYPGPTIISRRGRQTVVTHTNDLPVPVVVHLHGGVTPAEHDGHPDHLLLPRTGFDDMAGAPGVTRGRRDYVYPMDQPAGTLWYHDHRMDFTGPQVYRGLAGFHLVTDDNEQSLGLPSGARDIPLMVTDRSFDADGQLAYPSQDDALKSPGVNPRFASGVLGDCILVNGAPWPVLQVDSARYRLRILNASNARRYRFQLDPPDPGITVIGSDGNLLAAPVRVERLEVAQGERYDVVVDFSACEVGDEVTLRNTLGTGGTDLVLRFTVTRRTADTSRVPDALAPVEALQESAVVARRQFWFSRGGTEHGMPLWTINGEPYRSGSILARPRLGTVERWTIHALNVPHPFHIHLAPFQVLSREGDPGAAAPSSGWKDTVSLDNGGSADLLIRFDGYRGRYVFHCHNLEHEDMRMMADFEVV